MTGLTVRLLMRLRPRRVELLVRRVLVVAEDENDLLGLAGLEAQLDVVRADRRPAVGDRVERLAALDRRRVVPTAVGAQERVALGVEAGQLGRAGEIGEVVAPLAILGLVVDDLVFDLDLAGAEVALEIGGVVLRVPEAELDAGEERELRAASGGGWSPGTSRFPGSRPAARNSMVCASIFL